MEAASVSQRRGDDRIDLRVLINAPSTLQPQEYLSVWDGKASTEILSN